MRAGPAPAGVEQRGAQVGGPFLDIDAVQADGLERAPQFAGTRMPHRNALQGEPAVGHGGGRMHSPQAIKVGRQPSNRRRPSSRTVISHCSRPRGVMRDAATMRPRSRPRPASAATAAGRSGTCTTQCTRRGPLVAHRGAQPGIVEVEPAPAPIRRGGRRRVGRDDLEVGARMVDRRDAQQAVVRAHQRVLAARPRRDAQRGLAPGHALREACRPRPPGGRCGRRSSQRHPAFDAGDAGAADPDRRRQRRARHGRGRRGPARCPAPRCSARAPGRRPISHCASAALRLPVTGSSVMPLLPGKKARTSNAHASDGPEPAEGRTAPTTPTLPRGPTTPTSSPARMARVGAQREHLGRLAQQHAAPVGAVVAPRMARRCPRVPRPGRARSVPRRPRPADRTCAAAGRRMRAGPQRRPRRRRGGSSPARRRTPARCGRPWRLAAGLQPGVAAAQRRVAGERQFATRTEDAQLVVGLGMLGRQHEGGLRQVGPVGEATASVRCTGRGHRGRRRPGCRDRGRR